MKKLMITVSLPSILALFFFGNCLSARIASGVKVIKNVEYAVYQGESMQLDIYLPSTKGPYPLIIWIHGGAFRMGNRSWIEQGAMDQTGRGYALASVIAPRKARRILQGESPCRV